MSENEWKLFVEGWKWTWQSSLSFLSFLQWWKQTRNEVKFQLHSFCFSFLQCLMIVSNSRKTKAIVILFVLWFEKAWLWSNWSKWSKSQPHLQSMFWMCFLSSSFWFEDCWKREMWKEVWNLLVRNNWWNSSKKDRKKGVIFRICQTGWNSLAIGLAEWLKLVEIKQTTISTTTELDFLIIKLSERERRNRNTR